MKDFPIALRQLRKQAGMSQPELAEKHIRALLEQNGFKDYTVKIFTDTAKYTARMDQLQTEESHANPEVIQLMKDISL